MKGEKLLETLTCEYDADENKEISDTDEGALLLEEGDKKARTEKNLEALMEAVPYEDDDVINKAISNMDVEALNLEEDNKNKSR